MSGQIFKQIWFYRRSSLWLFCELTVIVTASWFLVNEIWTEYYRGHCTPFGYDYDGVYVLELESLSEGQAGYSADYETFEAMTETLARFGRTLSGMPEVESCALTGKSLPGLRTQTANFAFPMDTSVANEIPFSLHSRQTGAKDMEIMRYRRVWPENSPIEDVPGTVVITNDLAVTLFHGENPVGRRLSDASESPDAAANYNWVISGVVEPLKHSYDEEPRPMVCLSNASIFNGYASPCYIFRLTPGTDVHSFIKMANSTWERDMPYGNWRVSAVTPMPELMGKYIFSDTFKWKALWVFLLINVFIAMASYSWLRLKVRRSDIGVSRAMGASAANVVLRQLEEVWTVYAGALVIGLMVTVNIILFAKIGTVSAAGMVLPVIKDSLPLLYDPAAHFLAVTVTMASVLFVVVTVAAAIPLGKALRESTADILKDE